ncbi:MAG: HIT domain-containing protein [Fretibacterium sp.]|nr:HIT domain-containing protein [Fretibacterium sp.]
MQQLYATWRMSYIEAPKPKTGGCIFCDFPAEHRDEEHFILHRGKTCFVIMNLYPYTAGHVMVIPFRHTNIYESLTDEEALEMHHLTAHTLTVLKRVMRPDGFNMGINLGEPAGAGVAGHLHRHIVPRWAGDNNFMPVLADTRVLADAVENTYHRLREAWNMTNEK